MLQLAPIGPISTSTCSKSCLILRIVRQGENKVLGVAVLLHCSLSIFQYDPTPDKLETSVPIIIVSDAIKLNIGF
jgi:hypothetical protein